MRAAGTWQLSTAASQIRKGANPALVLKVVSSLASAVFHCCFLQERAHVLGVLCLLGVSMATAGSFAVHWLQQGPALHWLGVRSMKGGALHSI